MIAIFQNGIEANGTDVPYHVALEYLPVMARETLDCQEVFTAGERTFGFFTTLQTYIAVAWKHSKDELKTGIGKGLRHQMRQSLVEEPQLCDSPKGHFTQLALALKTTVHVALLGGQMCKKDTPGATCSNAILEHILPTFSALRGETWEEV
ncbi:hypothetical protein NUU61_001405 [Penicillium alfredii]|uniref:Uncharacterized protein n=1 Tax=Penicillium alfredii TaxID=1506179 RepID=A0A9W9G411_9EURO|nr:uncharacterized protein NUU61_001405 [Penicillium alfredii]KAJ5111775.1 hypothetical protein NUU61_001405 [Penicillium alfredii]